MIISNDLFGRITITGTVESKVPTARRTSAYGEIRFSGSLRALKPVPNAAFDDFAIFAVGDNDPAMTYMAQSSGPIQLRVNNLSQGITYNSGRAFVNAAPPKAYPTSVVGGVQQYAWKQAAYAAVGFRFENMVDGNLAYLENVQVEVLPTTEVAPTPYQTPRQVAVRVKPDRLNYAANPSFAVDISSWAQYGVASGTLDTTTATPTDTRSLAVTLNGPPGTSRTGYGATIRELRVGTTYTASAYVNHSQGDSPTADVFMNAMANLSVSTPQLSGGLTYLTSTDRAADSYGVANTWRRVSVTFTATATTMYVAIYSPRPTSTTGAIVRIANLLVEEGSSLRPYFDGRKNDGEYMWEVGGTAGLTRSYYYQDRTTRNAVVKRLLQENVPLGISVAEPVYGTLPIS